MDEAQKEDEKMGEHSKKREESSTGMHDIS